MQSTIQANTVVKSDASSENWTRTEHEFDYNFTSTAPSFSGVQRLKKTSEIQLWVIVHSMFTSTEMILSPIRRPEIFKEYINADAGVLLKKCHIKGSYTEMNKSWITPLVYFLPGLITKPRSNGMVVGFFMLGSETVGFSTLLWKIWFFRLKRTNFSWEVRYFVLTRKRTHLRPQPRKKHCIKDKDKWHLMLQKTR